MNIDDSVDWDADIIVGDETCIGNNSGVYSDIGFEVGIDDG